MNFRDYLKKATAALETLYDKEAEIKREQSIIKPNGADGKDWVTVLKGVPCRLSSPGLNNTIQKGANEIQYDVKMFLSSAFIVKAGDIIIVEEDGRKLKFESAREPFKYETHQEVLLLRKGYA